MRYKVRDGIVLKNICDEWLLIAVGKAAEHCLYVRQINDSLAWYWTRISSGMSSEDIVNEAVATFDVPRDLIVDDLNDLVSQLHTMGYLI